MMGTVHEDGEEEPRNFLYPLRWHHLGVRFLHSVETLHRVSKSAAVGLQPAQ